MPMPMPLPPARADVVIGDALPPLSAPPGLQVPLHALPVLLAVCGRLNCRGADADAASTADAADAAAAAALVPPGRGDGDRPRRGGRDRRCLPPPRARARWDEGRCRGAGICVWRR